MGQFRTEAVRLALRTVHKTNRKCLGKGKGGRRNGTKWLCAGQSRRTGSIKCGWILNYPTHANKLKGTRISVLLLFLSVQLFASSHFKASSRNIGLRRLNVFSVEWSMFSHIGVTVWKRDEPWSYILKRMSVLKCSLSARDLKWKIKNRLTNYRIMNVSETPLLKGTQLQQRGPPCGSLQHVESVRPVTVFVYRFRTAVFHHLHNTALRMWIRRLGLRLSKGLRNNVEYCGEKWL